MSLLLVELCLPLLVVGLHRFFQLYPSVFELLRVLFFHLSQVCLHLFTRTSSAELLPLFAHLALYLQDYRSHSINQVLQVSSSGYWSVVLSEDFCSVAHERLPEIVLTE